MTVRRRTFLGPKDISDLDRTQKRLEEFILTHINDVLLQNILNVE